MLAVRVQKGRRNKTEQNVEFRPAWQLYSSCAILWLGSVFVCVFIPPVQSCGLAVCFLIPTVQSCGLAVFLCVFFIPPVQSCGLAVFFLNSYCAILWLGIKMISGHFSSTVSHQQG